MSEQITPERHQENALKLFKKLPGARHYALTPESQTALAAFSAAYVDAGGDLTRWTEPDGELAKYFNQLGEFAPGMFQEREGEPPKLPELPKNPLDGAPMPNPWTKGSENLDAQSAITKRNPELADLMQRAAVEPWKLYFELEDAKKARERAAAITYTSEDHAGNPYVRGDMTAQAKLAKFDPVKAERFKKEAEPVRLPFTPGNVNLTTKGQLLKRNPTLYELTERANRIHQKWIDDKLAALKAAEAKARADREAIEKQIEAQAKPKLRFA